MKKKIDFYKNKLRHVVKHFFMEKNFYKIMKD